MTNDDAPVYRASVRGRRDVTPRLVGVTLGDVTGPGGAAFESTGRADEFFGLWVPGPDGQRVKRYYTVRDWRPEVGELDIEFVRHGDGVACAWAERAEPGDEVAFDAPRGHWAPPADTERLVVAGDATALPAIARILAERAPTSPPADVVMSVDDPADRIDVPLLAADRLKWVAADELVGAFRAAVTDAGTRVFAWFSGEASAMRDARRLVRHELALPTIRWATMGYWRRDGAAWARRVRAAPGLVDELEALYAEPATDDEELRDRADALLEQRGL